MLSPDPPNDVTQGQKNNIIHSSRETVLTRHEQLVLLFWKVVFNAHQCIKNASKNELATLKF